ncbi:MAG: adenylate/guanylate cyclase domain-containing protein [Candidatus Eiseniibacteriota bacterium]
MQSEAATVRIAALVDWLLRHSRQLTSPEQFLEDFAVRLRRARVPVWRINLHLPPLHPVILGRIYQWVDGAARPIEIMRSRDARDRLAFHHSPVAIVFRSGLAVRRRLAGPDADVDFPLLEELRDRGATDYYLLPLDMVAGGRRGAIGFTTREPDGFSEDAISVIDHILPALNAITEVFTTRLILHDTLDVYVGPEATQRILRGEITLGTGRSIGAAIWYTDLRGFTSLSETLDREVVLGVLNDYFACMVPAVQEAGGEILKFMGDALLAIFKFETRSREDTCAAVLEAAIKAVDAMTALNDKRAAAAMPPIEAGVALHVGDVVFGNIGAGSRLDFTVIGPAVNLASRIETLCRDLGERILVSEAFAAHAGTGLESLGRHAFRGVATEHELYRPARTATRAVS